MEQMLQKPSALAEPPGEIAKPTKQVSLREVTSANSVGFSYTLQLARVAIPLWAFDMLAVISSLAFGLAVVTWLGQQVNHFLPFIGSSMAVYSLCYWASGIYPGVGVHPARELKQLFRGSLTASLALSIGVLLVATWRSPYLAMVGIGLLGQCLLIPGGRGLAKGLMRSLKLGVPFYFVGSHAAISKIHRDMVRFGWTMLTPAGRFSANENDTQPLWDRGLEKHVPFLGTEADLRRSASKDSVHWLFVADEKEICLGSAAEMFTDIVWINSTDSNHGAGGAVMNCGLVSGIRVEESLLQPWPKLMKRLLDVVIAGGIVVGLSPVLLFLALAVKLSSPGPIFYFHRRIGYRGRQFKAWKFRSMVPNADSVLEAHLEKNPELRDEWDRDHKLKNDPRVTLIGKILRKTSLDEIPQVWNVLVGDMSLVGPRPIVEAEIEKYGETFKDYLRVPPGITGLWQISGRNNTTYAERLTYDEFYVRHWSPWLDLYILFRTVKTVLFCEGAY